MTQAHEIDDLAAFIAEESTDPAFVEALEDARRRSELIRVLTRLRRDVGLRQVDVALAMKTAQSCISELEGGATDPHISTLQRYARAVGATVTWRVASPRSEIQVEALGAARSSASDWADRWRRASENFALAS